MAGGREARRTHDRQPGRAGNREVAGGLFPTSGTKIVRGEFRTAVPVQRGRAHSRGENAARDFSGRNEVAGGRETGRELSSTRLQRKWRSEQRDRICRLRTGGAGRR